MAVCFAMDNSYVREPRPIEIVLRCRAAALQLSTHHSAFAFVAPPFAHTWPTLRLTRGETARSTSPASAQRRGGSCAKRLAKHWGETGGTLGVQDIGNSGKDG